MESLVIYQSLCENLTKTAPVLYAIMPTPRWKRCSLRRKRNRQLSTFREKLPQDDLSAFRFCSFFSKDAAPGSDLLHRDLLLAAQRNELLRHSVIGDHRLHLLQCAVGKQRRSPVFGRIDQQIGLLAARDRRALDLIFLPVGNAEAACGRQRRNAKNPLLC